MMQRSWNTCASDRLHEVMRAFDFLKTVVLQEQKDVVLAPVSVLLKLTVFHRAQIKSRQFRALCVLVFCLFFSPTVKCKAQIDRYFGECVQKLGGNLLNNTGRMFQRSKWRESGCDFSLRCHRRQGKSCRHRNKLEDSGLRRENQRMSCRSHRVFLRIGSSLEASDVSVSE